MRRLLLSLLAGAASLAGAQTLTLHYQERPPYSQTTPDGQVVGLVAEPAARALTRAGIDFVWARTPSQRQLALIQTEGAGLHCGVGWFRTDARATLGRFSDLLYRDRPLAALLRAGIRPPSPTATAAGLIADPRLQLLVKDGYSYGPRLDRLIAEAARAPQRTSVEPLQMSRMLASGRADWMIVAPEEAAALAQPTLRLVPLADEPDGPARHLYCNRAVPAEWIDRIDRALAARDTTR